MRRKCHKLTRATLSNLIQRSVFSLEIDVSQLPVASRTDWNISQTQNSGAFFITGQKKQEFGAFFELHKWPTISCKGDCRMGGPGQVCWCRFNGHHPVQRTRPINADSEHKAHHSDPNLQEHNMSAAAWTFVEPPKRNRQTPSDVLVHRAIFWLCDFADALYDFVVQCVTLWCIVQLCDGMWLRDGMCDYVMEWII